jgi:ribosomal protein S27AE
MVKMKNVTTEPVFTIKKQCDRCRNVLYFADTVITDIETDADGKILQSSIVCPVCGNVIVLYSIKEPSREHPALKIIGESEEA